MATSVPGGYHTITPRIFAPDPASLVEFLKVVFDATGEFDPRRPSELCIGDSLVMVGGTEFRPAMPVCLYVYVDDVDATYGRALAAGARSMEEPRDLPYGDRRAMVEDPWGDLFQIAARPPGADG